MYSPRMKALHIVPATLRFTLALLFGLFLLGGCKGTITADPSVETVKAFYNWRIAKDISGVPTKEQLNDMRPYLSKELSELLTQTTSDYGPSDTRSAARTIENGDWFTSMFDGPTSFRVGEVRSEGTLHYVSVRFTAAKQLPAVNWHDQIVVVEEEGKHVIANVVYENHWAFKDDATLIDVLKDPKARRKRRS